MGVEEWAATYILMGSIDPRQILNFFLPRYIYIYIYNKKLRFLEVDPTKINK